MKDQKMSTCNGLDLERLGSQMIMPKISPDTGVKTLPREDTYELT